MDVGVDSGPAVEWEKARWSTGVEPIGEIPVGAGPRTVRRTFAFVDMSGSTVFLEQMGTRAAADVVSAFRNNLREICARRGVRVAKWLGDGAMLVGVSAAPVVASCFEACVLRIGGPLPVRAGVAQSDALLLEGEDYLARGANLSARLTDVAPVSVVRCSAELAGDVPVWMPAAHRSVVDVRGFGDVEVLDFWSVDCDVDGLV